MMFIIRAEGGRVPNLTVKLRRNTPPILPDSVGKIDYFCLGDPDAARAAGWTVVCLHDGWYADDTGGGVAIWGEGQFWEIRATPFRVIEAAAPADLTPGVSDNAPVDVRKAVFGA
ncbi:MAG: hypothetical protein U1E70_26380 [Acetobacteraceae bacterium]